MIPYITVTENQLKAVFGEKFSLAAVKRDRKLLKLLKNYLYHNGFERTMANGNNSFTFDLAPKTAYRRQDGVVDSSPRVSAPERLDASWRASGRASLDARLWSGDGMLNHILTVMRRQGERE